MSLTWVLTAVVERLIELEVDTNLRDTLDDVRLFTQQLLVEIASHARQLQVSKIHLVQFLIIY